MFTDDSFDSDSFEFRRVKYLRVIFAVCSLLMLFFTLRYNIEYNLPKYNPVLFTIFACYLITPWLFVKFKSYNIAAGWCIITSSIMLTFFLYTCGGIQAPGIFWLTTIPFTGGILLGRRGGLLSALGMVGIFLLLYVLEHFTEVPNIVAELNIYKQEKFVNIICYLSYSLLTSYYFIKKETEATQEIDAHRMEIESFLRILIHDVANPAQFIQFGLEEIKDKNLDPAERDIIMLRLDRNVENLVSILQQVRQFKALKDGKIQIDVCRTNVNRIIDSIIEVQTPKIKEKSLQVNIKAEAKDTFAMADAIILHNVVLSNLITNSIKFSARGGQIDITISETDSVVSIKIQDYGIGIPKDLLGKLFNVNASTSREGTLGEKGTGYGLPLAREYVERMHGTISVVSRETAEGNLPRGTTTVISLPLAGA